MTTSENINELAAALAKAQGQIEGATKNSANPFFKSKYADLASVWDACRKPLSDNGLSILQSPSSEATPEGLRVSVETLLLHASGQWIRGVVSVSAKEDSPQAAGSCISYLRRYALQSFAGVCPEEDDAEAAQGRGKPNGKAQPFTPIPAPDGYAPWLAEMQKSVDAGIDRLKSAWQLAPSAYRDYLTRTDPKRWEGMKAAAQAVTDHAKAKATKVAS